MLILFVATTLLFCFLNGFDSASIVAPVIVSRAMSPRRALFAAALAEFCGPFLFGVAVARTVGQGLVDTQAVTLTVVWAGVLAAIVWNGLAWALAAPSSSSHALLGGLLGAVLLAAGPAAIRWEGLLKVLLALFLAPPVGLAVGFGAMRLVLFLAQAASPRINHWFRRAQFFTSVGLALSHGANDAQKTMGILTLGLMAGGLLPGFAVPLWTVWASALMLALGTLCGGWRLIRALGGGIYLMRPVHGFAAHGASLAVLLSAALLGGPVSATHVISSAIMGVGAAERLSKVRWGAAENMLWAWGLTIPATALVGAGIFWLAQVLNG